MIDTYIAIAIFTVTYALIVTERVHKTTAALAGGMAMIGFKVLTTEHAFEAISLEVIFLLAGMMMIANTLASTGVFQWMAIRTVKVARGSPVRVLLILCVITADASAFLDNVTTVVLMAPVTFVVARTLEVRVTPMLIAEALASNIGGTSTLIGDPPNILIATHANIDFQPSRSTSARSPSSPSQSSCSSCRSCCADRVMCPMRSASGSPTWTTRN